MRDASNNCWSYSAWSKIGKFTNAVKNEVQSCHISKMIVFKQLCFQTCLNESLIKVSRF